MDSIFPETVRSNAPRVVVFPFTPCARVIISLPLEVVATTVWFRPTIRTDCKETQLGKAHLTFTSTDLCFEIIVLHIDPSVFSGCYVCKITPNFTRFVLVDLEAFRYKVLDAFVLLELEMGNVIEEDPAMRRTLVLRFEVSIQTAEFISL